MKTVVATFAKTADARRAADRLAVAGIPTDRITVLAPGASARDLDRAPTSETESPGTGTAVGGAVGAAAGLSAGFGAAALFLIPGVGQVGALGVLAAALLGAGGAAAGAAIGHAVEDSLGDGVPRDELFFYEETLREGRTVVIALVDDDAAADRARDAFAQAGAETLDAARERWWIGLRDVEAREEPAAFARDERAYRQGFESALHPDARGRAYDDVGPLLQRRCPDAYGCEPFRRGFDRGQRYLQGRRSTESSRPARTGT